MLGLEKLFDSNEKQVNKLRSLVAAINALEPEYEKLPEAQLRAKTDLWRQEVRQLADDEAQKQYLDRILPQAYALVREAGKRAIGQRAFDVQLMAAIVLHRGMIAEQKTGEGKTLAATLPLYLNALAGQGCHLVTPNDYLSRHGAGWMGSIYHLLGVSVGVIIHDQAFLFDPDYNNESFLDEYSRHLRPVSRQEAYQAEITYGTNNEFGFDYLRDNMVVELKQMVQTAPSGDWGLHHFAIVDEVDSILIDEARTPLIISAPAGDLTQRYYDVAKLIAQLVAKTDYNIDEKSKTAALTELGVNKLERVLGVDNLYEKDFETIHLVEQALKAKAIFLKDRDYVVKDGQVIIVDEFTGRLMPGRRYSEGLHQAIEAKEGVEIQRESRTLATISFQNYFRMYTKLAGMTGTAATEAEEFLKIYNLEVVVIPTNKPVTRQDYPDVVYKTETAKYRAIVQDIEEKYGRGQPVLVGTTSVEKNELLHEFLKRKKIPHEVLNAKQHEREALVIAQAGRKGAVTLATNMAGRGVDIILGGDASAQLEEVKVMEVGGEEKEKRRREIKDRWQKEHDEVLSLGGLHVIGTERHESRRIDNQLRGRSGRQGDPGSSRFYVALQDDLMRIFGGEMVENLMTRFGMDENVPLEHGMVTKAITNAQKRVEGHNFDIRKHLVEYDDVMNKQREVIYGLRRQLLELVTNPVAKAFSTPGVDKGVVEAKKVGAEDLASWLLPKIAPFGENLEQVWQDKSTKYAEIWPQVVLQISLPVIDMFWMEHLEAMDDVREGIGLRGYAQRDPLVEYKREGLKIFGGLLDRTYATIADRLVRVQIEGGPVREVQTVATRDQVQYQHQASDLGVGDEVRQMAGQSSQPRTVHRSGAKVGRNDPCPCGSGKKYKKCHGK